MELIKKIQSHLEKIYGIESGVCATDYLIGENELFQLLPSNMNTSYPKELFLVNPNPEDDTLEIALFLDQNLKTNLMLNSPLESLGGENISDFCTMIEGVSHFVYYLYKASLEHDVTQLELEIQAEIDKFVLLSIFVESDLEIKHKLLDMLFEDFNYLDSLTHEQVERYSTATQLASRYCYSLLRTIKQEGEEKFLQEIRSFYPLSQKDKISNILN